MADESVSRETAIASGILSAIIVVSGGIVVDTALHAADVSLRQFASVNYLSGKIVPKGQSQTYQYGVISDPIFFDRYDGGTTQFTDTR